MSVLFNFVQIIQGLKKQAQYEVRKVIFLLKALICSI